MSYDQDVPLVALTSPDVALHWHEAVAVVAELAASVGAAGVPGVEGLRLTSDGRVVISSPAGPGDDPVRALGTILDTLVEGRVAPSEVRILASEAASGASAIEDVAGFSHALTFFERPGRKDTLQVLARRAREVAAQREMQAMLERLQERARTAQAAPPVPEPAAIPRRARSRHRLVAVALLALVVGLVGAALLFGPRAGDGQGEQTLVGRAQDGLAQAVRSGLDAIAPAPPAPAPPAQEAQPVPETKTGRAGRAARPTSRVPPAANAGPRRPTARGPAAQDAGSTAGSGPTSGASASNQRIYSALDLDVEPPALVSQVAQAGDSSGAPGVRVEPPRLLRPQMPSAMPSTRSPDDVGVLEVLVNEEGNVERVRLISPSNRFQDRMLVSAAKTWKFTPAMREGRPVRYLARVTITL